MRAPSLWPTAGLCFAVIGVTGPAVRAGHQAPRSLGHPANTAPVVFWHGTVYTNNATLLKAQAIAVSQGRVVWVGPDSDAHRYVGKGTKIVDLRGAAVFPGFTDSHCHLSGIGERELTLNLEGTPSLAALLEKVKERVSQAKPGEWITGRGWIETFWKPQTFPTRQQLDTVSPDNPLLLTRADGHAAVANSAALKAAAVTGATANPFGGEILKDSAGEPTGMLLDNAQGLVRRFVKEKKPDPEEALLKGVERSLRLGWCQVQIAGSPWEETERLQRLVSDGRIKLRIYDAVYGPGPDAERLIQQGPIIGAYDNRFTLRDIKVVLDGALGSRGAALLEPYSDAKTSGFLTQKEEQVRPMLERALRAGIQVETHAIGDRTNRTILDWYEKAFEAVLPERRKVARPRWRVEHAQILHLNDVRRFGRLGIIASMQPSHAIGDLHFAPARLGMDRLAGAYAWRSLLDTGAMIAGGSDAPVERGEPMIEFYAAVARRDLKGYTGPGWHPEQAVSRRRALNMFTIWPAHAAFEEKIKGTIEPGKLADFTVLSADIMRIPIAEIPKTRCVMTVIGGEVVYKDSSYP